MLSRIVRFAVMPAPRRLLLVALLMVLPMVCATAAGGTQPTEIAPPPMGAAPSREHKHVLLLFGEDQDFPMINTLGQSIKSTLSNRSPSHIEFYTEYLDRTRINDAQYERELVNFWRKKYEDEKMDLIIVSTASALDLLSRHSDLFPGAPTVFSVLFEQELSQIKRRPNLTGVFSASPFRPTLELALRLHPDTQRVIVVFGSSDFEKGLLEIAKGELRDFANRVELVYLTDVTIAELQEKLASLPKHSVVLYGALTKDRTGVVFTGRESLALVAPTSAAPIYGFSRSYFGSGIVGGSLINFELLGERAAETGARILAGERPQNIAPQSVPNVVLFDWRELRRWGISEKSLPPGSTVQFIEESFLQRYRWQVSLVVALFVIESFLIAGLLVNRARWRQAEQAGHRLARLAEDQRRKLDEVISDVPGIVWEFRLEPGAAMKVHFVSNYVEKMLGYSVEECLSTPNLFQSIICDEDRQSLARWRDEMLASGQGNVIQFRWRAKDGRVLWAEAHLAPILDEAGAVVGLRGVSLDITSRKQAEEALLENRRRLAGVIDSAMDAIVSVDEHHRIRLLNPAAEKMFGVRAAEIIGLPVDVLIPERFREVHKEHIQSFGKSAMQSRSAGAKGGLFGLRVDGTEFPVEASISQVELNEQKYFTVILRDITERIRAEQAIKESEANYRSIFNAVNDAIFVHDIETGDVVDVNQIMCDMYKVTLEEARTLGLEALSSNEPPYTQEAALARIRKAVEGEPQLFEWRARDKAGRLFWVEVSLKRAVIGGKDRVLAVVRDITYRKQADEALRESEARFRNMADTAPVMIWMSDLDKKCTYFNKRWLDFTGRPLEAELGYGWTEGIHADDYEPCLQTYNSAFERREPFTMEYRLRRADGEFRWMYASGIPRLSANGKFLGYIGSCIDITERKTAEQALMDLSGQLIRAREDECARIARELHDDLSQRVALVSLELDQLSQNPPGSKAKLSETLHEIINQATELSNEIHRMSHDLHPSKLAHLGLVAALKSLCRELSEGYGLSIEFQHTDMPAALPKDVSLCLYRVVQESLSNVVRHSGAKEAQVELRGAEREIRLCIADSGSGFDIESARSKKGLGLISMRERLRLIGGTISIDSRILSGTKIDVRVPQGPPLVVAPEGLIANEKRPPRAAE